MTNRAHSQQRAQRAARRLADALNDRFQRRYYKTTGVVTAVQRDTSGRIIGATATIDGAPGQTIQVDVGAPISVGNTVLVQNEGSHTAVQWVVSRVLDSSSPVPIVGDLPTLPTPTGLTVDTTPVDAQPGQPLRYAAIVHWETIGDQYGDMGYRLVCQRDDPDIDPLEWTIINQPGTYTLLDGAIDADDTLICCDSVVMPAGFGLFPVRGRLKIDAELIDYTSRQTGSGDSGTGTGSSGQLVDSGKDWDDDQWVNYILTDSVGTRFLIESNTSTTLYVTGTPASGAYTIKPGFGGCSRGVGGTSPATHADDATIWPRSCAITIDELLPATDYNFRVRAQRLSDGAVSAWTAWVSETMPSDGTAPPAPSDFTVTGIEFGLEFSWSGPTYADAPDLCAFELWQADDLSGSNPEKMATLGVQYNYSMAGSAFVLKYYNLRAVDYSGNTSDWAELYWVPGHPVTQQFTNPSFEAGATSPTGWTLYSASPITVTWVSDKAYDGSKSVKFVAVSGDAGSGQVVLEHNSLIAVEQGMTPGYRLTFASYSNPLGSNVYKWRIYQFQDRSETPCATPYIDGTALDHGDETWEATYDNIILDTDCAYIRPCLIFVGTTYAETMWVDDFLLRPAVSWVHGVVYETLEVEPTTNVVSLIVRGHSGTGSADVVQFYNRAPSQDLRWALEADGDWVSEDGADLIMHSDGRSTVTFQVDGATGNITTVGTVDGVNVPDHSARHDIGGADALTTVAPAFTFDTSGEIGTGGDFVRSTAQIALFDTNNPEDIDAGNVADDGAAGKAARRDHVHGVVAYSDGQTYPEELLKTDASGYLQVARLGAGVSPGGYLHARGTTAPQLRLDYDSDDYVQWSIDATGQLTIETVSSSTGGNLILKPEGDLVLDPDAYDVVPAATSEINLGSETARFLTLYVDEIWAQRFVAEEVVATIGGNFWVVPTTKLTRELGSSDTTIYVQHNQMRNGDRIFLKELLTIEYIAITSGPTIITPGEEYSYSCTRDLDGSGANTWQKGSAVMNTGMASAGWIQQHAQWSIEGRALHHIYNADYNGGGGVIFSDNYNLSASWNIFGDGANTEVTDAVYFGNEDQTWQNLYFNLATAGFFVATLTFNYWSGSSWTAFVPTKSGSFLQTTGFHYAEWTKGDLTGWAETTVNGVSAYWVRIMITSFTGWTTLPRQGTRRVASEKHRWGPTIVAQIRNSSTWSDVSEVAAFGNLAGLYGYGADTFGVAMGRYHPTGSDANILIDSTNGIRIMHRTGGTSTPIGQWDVSGNVLVGKTGTGNANTYITAGDVKLRVDTTDYIVLDGGVPFIRVGREAASQSNVYITAGSVALRNNTTERIKLNADGTFWAGVAFNQERLDWNASLGLRLFNHNNEAVIQFDTSGNADITNILRMPGASAAITMGDPPPTGSGTGTGIWIDQTGLYGLLSDTYQVKVDAESGSLIAGGGDVVLDVDGITMRLPDTSSSPSNELVWEHASDTAVSVKISSYRGTDAPGFVWGGIEVHSTSYAATAAALLDIFCTNYSTSSYISLWADFDGGEAHVLVSPWLRVYGNVSATGSLVIGKYDYDPAATGDIEAYSGSTKMVWVDASAGDTRMAGGIVTGSISYAPSAAGDIEVYSGSTKEVWVDASAGDVRLLGGLVTGSVSYAPAAVGDIEVYSGSTKKIRMVASTGNMRAAGGLVVGSVAYAPSGDIEVYDGSTKRFNLDVSAGSMVLIAPTSSVGYLYVAGPGDGTYFSQLRLVSDEATDQAWWFTHRAGATYGNQLIIQQHNGSTWDYPLRVKRASGLTITDGLAIGSLALDPNGAGDITYMGDLHPHRSAVLYGPAYPIIPCYYSLGTFTSAGPVDLQTPGLPAGVIGVFVYGWMDNTGESICDVELRNSSGGNTYLKTRVPAADKGDFAGFVACSSGDIYIVGVSADCSAALYAVAYII